jgi:hypothetical protein
MSTVYIDYILLYDISIINMSRWYFSRKEIDLSSKVIIPLMRLREKSWIPHISKIYPNYMWIFDTKP